MATSGCFDAAEDLLPRVSPPTTGYISPGRRPDWCEVSVNGLVGARFYQQTGVPHPEEGHTSGPSLSADPPHS